MKTEIKPFLSKLPLCFYHSNEILTGKNNVLLSKWGQTAMKPNIYEILNKIIILSFTLIFFVCAGQLTRTAVNDYQTQT